MANKEYKSDANLSLYEHQSTYCPNMPLRDLLYFASIIQKRIKAQKRDIYGGKILKIPVPHFVVFYNGKEEAPEQYDLRLSDAFEQETEHPEIEDGEKIGRKEQLSELIQKKILKNKPLDQIADELEESPETIRPLYEKIRQEMQQ